MPIEASGLLFIDNSVGLSVETVFIITRNRNSRSGKRSRRPRNIRNVLINMSGRTGKLILSQFLLLALIKGSVKPNDTVRDPGG